MGHVLEKTIEDVCGPEITITERRPVSGGDINAACVLTLSDGSKVFLKENTKVPGDYFKAEAKGLLALSSAGVIEIPKVLAEGRDGAVLFLMLSYIRGGAKKTSFWYDFGRRLALLHKTDTSPFTEGKKYGFSSDNFIGATRQINTPSDSWTGFFRSCRLEPQFKAAWGHFDPLMKKKINYLINHLEEWMTEPEYPSLLHGDLWGGNYMVSQDGSPVLIDPAVYVGNREADLAMTELFGGFHNDFYSGYEDEAGVPEGYEKRRDLYNLYHMLNHLNLFGGSYMHGVRNIIVRYS